MMQIPHMVDNIEVRTDSKQAWQGWRRTSRGRAETRQTTGFPGLGLPCVGSSRAGGRVRRVGKQTRHEAGSYYDAPADRRKGDGDARRLGGIFWRKYGWRCALQV